MGEKLRPGQRAPDFVLPTLDGTPTRFYGAAGGEPLRLHFIDGTVVVRTLDADEPLLAFRDADGQVADRFKAVDGDTIVLDANLRVAVDADSAAADARAAAQHDPVISSQAPVLLVPRVLSPRECDELIGEWAASGAEETGVETTQEATRAEIRNTKLKRRRDMIVEDRQRAAALARVIGQAVMPELRRAFHYRANQFEGFKIGCYDQDSAGFFSAHRDNLSPATAHRRFALSLNLNDDYEGGEVRFPEFGGARYRPPPGGALLFSGALLHEVLPVTRGRRFLLLSFLWGEDRAHHGHAHGA